MLEIEIAASLLFDRSNGQIIILVKQLFVLEYDTLNLFLSGP
jgi:hypothetical protein